ncbi:MAG: L,D-transpeptidase family protein [Hyphomicrobium sp.]
MPTPSYAQAVSPDDTPWTVEDTNPGTKPGSIEELLERDRRTIVNDTDINPPGPDQPDLTTNHDPDSLDRDQLAIPLPDEIHRAPDQVPQTAISTPRPQEAPSAGQPAAAALTAPNLQKGRDGTPQNAIQARPTARSLDPANGAPTALAPAQAVPSPVVEGKTAAPTNTIAPMGTRTAMPLAARPPREIPATPAPEPLVPKAPRQTAILLDSTDPDAPPRQSVPTQPVDEAAVAVNGKLYLPIKRYFDVNAASGLATYDAQDRNAAAAYYEKTLGEALWVTRDGFNDAARVLMKEIAKADDWGLARADYRLPDLAAAGVDYEYPQLLDAEVKLTLVALEYARHARGDRIDDPTQLLSGYIDRKPQLIERSKVIADLVAAPDKGAYLRSLHPHNPQFEALRKKLLELRAQQVAGTEPETIPDGPRVTPGKSHSSIAALRRRLHTPMPEAKADGKPPNENYYDNDLAAAVVAYKRKNDIEPANSTVTDELRASLNRQVKIDEQALLANMEQWRWMPEDLGETYVWVNIPEFLVRVVKHGEIIHEERIIAGRNETQTPIFSHELKTVVFQPSWNVPESIKVNELLPKLRRGSNPIERQGLRMERNGRRVDAWDVNWQRQDIRNYHIYQPPGRSNVLGVVKFLFPNKHAVYLHDTPTKKLFNETIRTYSHGCMRVRNPVQLAEVIMAEDKGWDKNKVDELVESGPEDNDVSLDKPLPVHITYFTMWVPDDGNLAVFPDVYGHEKRIELGLNGRWDQIDRNGEAESSGAVASRDDWGDEDDDSQRVSRQRRTPRYSSREAQRVSSSETQRASQRVPQKQKPGAVISDFMKQVFGAN